MSPLILAICALIGLFLTALGVFLAFWELRCSRKRACSETETASLKEFNESFLQFRSNPDIAHLWKAMNVLELLVKHVKHGVYPFSEFITDFLPPTLKFFYQYEKLYVIKDKNTLDAARENIKNYHNSLLPFFDSYVKQSDDFLKNRGTDRTSDNLKDFFTSDYMRPDKRDVKKLKKSLKKRAA
jgi:hypothetical protein